MIELTFEMLEAYAAGASSVTGLNVEASATGLAAVLAIVARDYCLERRGHVWHPLRRSPGEVPWGLP